MVPAYTDLDPGIPSALMKLYDNHSCDSFATKSNDVSDLESLKGIYEITEMCRKRIIDTVSRILNFLEAVKALLEQGQESEANSPTLAPWLSPCVYRASAALAWIGSAASYQEEWKTARDKAVCVNILQKLDEDWSIAGRRDPVPAKRGSLYADS
jgi:hypothetical protein